MLVVVVSRRQHGLILAVGVFLVEIVLRRLFSVNRCPICGRLCSDSEELRRHRIFEHRDGLCNVVICVDSKCPGD
ncbi:MAG: hypothetical protein NWE93_02805 [Candidatus Bathyarchaeota archaeon]|nr:hypothetical protein [Candidatus Bathyarchaeota archaeon]